MLKFLFLIYLLSLSNIACSSTQTGEVVEFYHPKLQHYFITADPNEAKAIDAGGAGPGWERTGEGFAAGGETPVCRFYGSVSPGPNSHFYTADQNECNDLILIEDKTPATQKRWNLESLGFYTDLPEEGVCLGSQPVYRAYNNGFARGVDSNHRVINNLVEVMEEVIQKGWVAEGATMCAPLPFSLVLTGKYPQKNFLHLLEGCDTVSTSHRDNVSEPTMDLYINKCKQDGSMYPKVYIASITGCDTVALTKGLKYNTVELYVNQCNKGNGPKSTTSEIQQDNLKELNSLLKSGN